MTQPNNTFCSDIQLSTHWLKQPFTANINQKSNVVNLLLKTIMAIIKTKGIYNFKNIYWIHHGYRTKNLKF